MQLFSADATVFFKKILKNILTPKKWKNWHQKLLKISSEWIFPYYEISGPDICSLICALGADTHKPWKVGLDAYLSK